MGIARVLKRFDEPFDIIRRSTLFAREKGRAKQVEEPTTFSDFGGIQPAGPKDLERLVIGR